MADSGNNNTTSTISSMSTGFRSERSDSTSSAGSGSSANSGSPTSPRRASHGLFEGLTAQKRKDDPASVARRQSMNEQQPQSGFIGNLWNNWVHGSGSNK